MKRILVAGIGNVLLGDDGVGPYVARSLASSYVFDEGVEVEDLGTPALDLIDHVAGLDALIVVDAVNNGSAPGTLTLYRKQELTRHVPAMRLDPHSPALSDALWAAEFYGSCPQEVLLVGITGEVFEGACMLSEAVRASVEGAIHEVLRELDRLNVGSARRFEERVPDIWWEPTRAVLAV
jgi:hydrogenase maturation protease